MIFTKSTEDTSGENSDNNKNQDNNENDDDKDENEAGKDDVDDKNHKNNEDKNGSNDNNNGMNESSNSNSNKIGDDDASYSSSGTDSDQEGSEEDEDFVPANYIFASFMAYVLWGPFAIESEKLSLFSLDDEDKATFMSRSQRRKVTMKKNSEERENDRSAVRGFSTDQRINIQALNINKKRLEHQRNQTYLVGLSIQDAAMARQIESAEKRATIRCPVYNPRNMHWKICDDLIKTHNELVSSITSKTEALFSNENDEKDDDGDDTVGTFLNQP